MKIGIIADIHGNLHALNAVLSKLEKAKVEKLIFNRIFRFKRVFES